MSDETLGFNSYEVAELSRIISGVLKLPAIERNNTWYGTYYRFRPHPNHDHDHILVSNEIPPGFKDRDDAPEPDLFDYKCIFWTGHGYEFGRAAPGSPGDPRRQAVA